MPRRSSFLPWPRPVKRWARWWLTGRAIYRVFRQYGYFRSRAEGRPLDAEGAELPWFTYPAIEYLRQLDFSQKSVFEFGAGHSTLFWSRRAARVVSVENDPAWHAQLLPRLGANVALHLVESPTDYPTFISRQAGKFDVIVVDGIERRRCVAEAVQKLNPGGLIILDNSDWHHLSSAALRAEGLLEVDLAGFGPINAYVWTTSLYFHRQFDVAPAADRQPVHSIGALAHFENDGAEHAGKL